VVVFIASLLWEEGTAAHRNLFAKEGGQIKSTLLKPLFSLPAINPSHQTRHQTLQQLHPVTKLVTCTHEVQLLSFQALCPPTSTTTHKP
jgi:hypothetical protein